MVNGNGQPPRLITLTRAVEDITPEHFLRTFAGDTRIFWQRGQYASVYAGAGAAVTLAAEGADRFTALRMQIEAVFHDAHNEVNAPSEVRPRFFGGFAFEDAPSDALWEAFGSARLILPRYLLTRAGGYCWLTLCDYAKGSTSERLTALHAEFERVAARLRMAVEACPPTPDAAAYPLIDQAGWRGMLERGIGLIHQGELSKIVLARVLDSHGTVDAVGALAALEKSYPTAYRFLIAPDSKHAFFGATPELLARLEDGGLHTHALAGSTRRGSTPDDDDRLARELLASVKDRHEHALVVEWLRETLTPISRTVEIGALPQVVKLKNIQHLFTPVQAQLRDRAHLLGVIERLHPTPALGGTPQAAARAAIRTIEPFSRGWYAAPVGWVDAAGNGEFAVAIRSALQHPDGVRLYAGAGIVGDSDPDKEWEETTIKFQPMLTALRLSAEPCTEQTP